MNREPKKKGLKDKIEFYIAWIELLFIPVFIGFTIGMTITNLILRII